MGTILFSGHISIVKKDDGKTVIQVLPDDPSAMMSEHELGWLEVRALNKYLPQHVQESLTADLKERDVIEGRCVLHGITNCPECDT